MGLQTPSYLLPSEAPPGIQASQENTRPEITETRSFDIQMGKPRSRAGRGSVMSGPGSWLHRAQSPLGSGPPQAGQQSVWDDGFLAFSCYFPLTCLVPEEELDFSQDKELAVSGSVESFRAFSLP